MPILFGNDYLYCAGGILMALSSGYLSSLTMMYAPRLLNIIFTLWAFHNINTEYTTDGQTSVWRVTRDA